MVKSKRSIQRNFFTICLSLVILLLLSTALHARIYQNIVAFGDSLSDHNGLEFYIGLYDPINNPNGAPAVWSNGNVWVEYLADKWQADLDNNAIGGAMTKGHENESVQAMSDNGTFPQLGLVGQTKLYLAKVSEIDQENTLFTIWIGANDLMELGRGEYFTQDPGEMIAFAMKDISDSVVDLYAQGAKYFLILNLPDISKSPAYNRRSAEEIAAVTGLVHAYNGALTSTIEALKVNLDGISIDSFDMFLYLTEIIDAGTFLNAIDTYMEMDAGGNRTGAVNGPADDYLFWDSVHPMTRAHELIADKISETLYPREVDDDGSSTCFISSIHAGTTHGANRLIWLLVPLMIVGFVRVIFKKRV